MGLSQRTSGQFFIKAVVFRVLEVLGCCFGGVYLHHVSFVCAVGHKACPDFTAFQEAKPLPFFFLASLGPRVRCLDIDILELTIPAIQRQ